MSPQTQVRQDFVLIFNGLWAKHTMERCQTRINSQKVEGTMFCGNRVLAIHEIWVTWRIFTFEWERIP